jgi:hypothetical protein
MGSLPTRSHLSREGWGSSMVRGKMQLCVREHPDPTFHSWICGGYVLESIGIKRPHRPQQRAAVLTGALSVVRRITHGTWRLVRGPRAITGEQGSTIQMWIVLFWLDMNIGKPANPRLRLRFRWSINRVEARADLKTGEQEPR